MTHDELAQHITFDEWALDITMADDSGALAFVPVCGDAIVTGYTIIADRSPGHLTAVISEHGLDHVNRWVEQNPTWQIDFGNADDLTNV